MLLIAILLAVGILWFVYNKKSFYFKINPVKTFFCFVPEENEYYYLFQTKLNSLHLQFDAAKLKGIPAEVEEYIKKISADITQISSQLQEVNDMSTTIPEQIVSGISDKMNFTTEERHVLASDLWIVFDFIKPYVEYLLRILPGGIATALPFVKAFIIAPTAIMVLVALVFVICIVLFTFEACQKRLFSPTGEGPSKGEFIWPCVRCMWSKL